jgi:hypothetical protein
VVKHTCSKYVFFLELGEAPDLMLKEKEVGRDNFSSNSSCINIAKHVLPTSGCLTNLCCFTLVSLQSYDDRSIISPLGYCSNFSFSPSYSKGLLYMHMQHHV